MMHASEFSDKSRSFEHLNTIPEFHFDDSDHENWISYSSVRNCQATRRGGLAHPIPVARGSSDGGCLPSRDPHKCCEDPCLITRSSSPMVHERFFFLVCLRRSVLRFLSVQTVVGSNQSINQ
jgi:hypothetical protein